MLNTSTIDISQKRTDYEMKLERCAISRLANNDAESLAKHANNRNVACTLRRRVFRILTQSKTRKFS